MAHTIPVDLEWAACGYLMLPDGHCRHIIGLDMITHDILRAGATVCWADLPGGHPALCHVETRSILLATWVYWVHPAYLRRILTEELGHVVVGHSEEEAYAWQWRHYRDILLPAWAA